MAYKIRSYFIQIVFGVLLIVLFIKLFALFDSNEMVILNTTISSLPTSNDDTISENTYNNYTIIDYVTIGNPICLKLFPSSMRFLHHHKTGTALNIEMGNQILEYCDIQYKDKIIQEYHKWQRFIPFRQKEMKLQSDHVNIHMLRDPVLTIISGFKYHLTSTEPWAIKKLSLQKLNISREFFNFETDIDKLYDIYVYLTRTYDIDTDVPIYQSSRITYNQRELMKQFYGGDTSKHPFKIRVMYLYYMNYILNQMNLYKYGDYYGFNINFDDREIHKKYNIFRGDTDILSQNFNKYRNVKRWYNKMFGGSDENLKYGLYFEMLRYLFVVYHPEIYYYHTHFFKDKDEESELKMEIWNTDFDQNLNVILDKLNLVNNEQNRNRLIQNDFDLSYVDIDEERQKLHQKLKKADKVGHGINNGHIHSSRNNTKYINALLSIDPQICLLLKHITNIIQYGWQYANFC